MIFLSDFLNAEVVDLKQHRVGRVKDLIVVMSDPFPRVTGVVLKGNRRLRAIDWSVVRSWDNKELSLKVDAGSLQPHTRLDTELWLSRQVLDKQIVDMDGRRVVRVNDLQLSQVEGSMLLVGVDIGGRGLMRRIGLEGLGRRITAALSVDWPQKLISWEAVDPVKSDVSSVKLRIAHTKLARLHPADIAEIVHELGPEDRSAVFAALDDEKAADTLEEIDEPQMQASILERLDVDRASDILEAMAPDEAADLLADMPRERAQQLLQKMEEDEAEDVEELLAYREDTAGGLMTTQYVAVLHTLTAEQAIERLRELEPDAEQIFYVYVIDEEEHLLGVLSLRDLIVAKPDTQIRDFMIAKVVSVSLDAGPREVAEAISKYNLLAVPVVDQHNRIHGIVTVDDVMERVMPTRSGARRRGLFS
ncbi:MAG TPA: CBS domain-containing protein [Candidatus Limnocylindrales bacterium]|nr:CBS domain-containing protein [Candidatus Limnocylindrales bacterium]